MPVITTLVGSKIALGVVALIALGGGLAITASAGTLPEPLVTESPAPTDDPIDDGIDDESDDQSDEGDEGDDEGDDGEESGNVGGPDATGPAGFGLCTAYFAGGLATVSTAYDSLSTAAGEGGIDAFCEIVVANKKGVSEKKSGVTHGKSGVSDTEPGKPADKPAKPDKPEKPATSNQGGNGGGNGHGNANGHNKH